MFLELPARSRMADVLNVMIGVALDETGGVGFSISSTLFGISFTLMKLAKVRRMLAELYKSIAASNVTETRLGVMVVDRVH